MKKLTVIRHAAAEKFAGRGDYFRPLSEAGRIAAAAAGDFLAQHAFPELMLVSGALRAMETALIIAEKIHFPCNKIVYDKSIYTADGMETEKIIAAAAAGSVNVFLVGHNPALSDFILAVSKLEKLHLPPGGVVSLKFSGDDWASGFAAKGKIEFAKSF